MPIDWSAARTPNFFELYQQSFEQGRQFARERAADAARQNEPADGPQAELAEGPDERTPEDLWSLVHSFRDEDGTAARQHAEALRGVATGLLATPDLNHRLSMARHVAAEFPQFGIAPEHLTANQVSDAALRQEVEALSQYLARSAGPSRQQDGSVAQ